MGSAGKGEEPKCQGHLTSNVHLVADSAGRSVFYSRWLAKPNHANGSATPQSTAIGKNDAPPYLAYRIPDNNVRAAVVTPAPNA